MSRLLVSMFWKCARRFTWRARLTPALALAAVLLAGCSQGLAQPPSGPAPTPIQLTSTTGVGVSSAPPGAWQSLSGYTMLQQPSLTPDPLHPDVAYLCSSGPTAGANYEAGGAGALSLQRTTDGGKTWEDLLVPPAVGVLSCSLSVDPADAQDLFLYLGFSSAQQPEPNAVLYRSQNGGQSWARVNQPGSAQSLLLSGADGTVPIVSWNQQLFGLAVPWQPNSPLADTHRLFTSKDDGASWQPIDGALVKQGLVALTFTEIWGQLLAVTSVSGGGARAENMGPHSSGGPQADLWSMDLATGAWSQQPSAIPDVVPLSLTQPDARLFTGDVPMGPRAAPATLYYVRAEQPVILRSQDDGASWTPVPLPDNLRLFAPLAAGANEALYGYTLFDTASEAAYQGIFWGADGAWHLATPGMPPSTVISVSPEGLQSGLDSWWALDTAALTVWRYLPAARTSIPGNEQPTNGSASQ